MSKFNFTELHNEAIMVLLDREKRYGSYSNHIKLFAPIFNSVYDDLLNFTIMSPLYKTDRAFVNSMVNHCACLLSLKFVRIICNADYKDSYIDAIGYITLLLNALSLHSVKLRYINGYTQLNNLIEYINKEVKNENIKKS